MGKSLYPYCFHFIFFATSLECLLFSVSYILWEPHHCRSVFVLSFQSDRLGSLQRLQIVGYRFVAFNYRYWELPLQTHKLCFFLLFTFIPHKRKKTWFSMQVYRLVKFTDPILLVTFAKSLCCFDCLHKLVTLSFETMLSLNYDY